MKKCYKVENWHTVYMEHLVDIKFGDLEANTGRLIFSLVNQIYS